MTRGISTIVLLFAAVLGFSAGCSSDPSPADGNTQCQPFTPCGGDFTGAWRLTESCLSATEAQKLEQSFEFCAQGTAQVSATQTGTAVFEAGGSSLQLDATVVLLVRTSFPTSCLGASQTCASVAAADAARPGVTRANCRDTPTGCSCEIDLKQASKRQLSYAKAGPTTLTETDPTDGSVSSIGYCVEGKTLRLQDDSGTFSLKR